MSDPEVVIKGGPADMIAQAWFQLGFRPVESLVMVGFDRVRRRSGLVVRADLPDRKLARRRVAAHLALSAEPLVRSGASNAVVLVCSHGAMEPGLRPLIGLIESTLARHGVPVFDVLGITDTAFRSLLCRAPSCCPVAGYPLSLVAESRVAVASVVAGMVLREEEADLVSDVLPDPDLAQTDSAWPEAAGSDPAGPGAAGPADQLPAGELPQDSAGWWRLWLVGQATGVGLAGSPRAVLRGLAAALGDLSLRDAVLVSALGADPAEAGALLSGGSGGPPVAGDPVPECLPVGSGSTPDLWTLMSRPPGQPDPRSPLAAASAALAAAARAGEPGRRAPALAALALLAWYAGDGVRARLLTERAAADDPAHTMTELVLQLLGHAVPPPWAAPDLDHRRVAG